VGGDTITCTVTPNDGTEDGTPDSGSILIGNTAPTVTDVTVLATPDADGDMDATTAVAADTLECSWTYDDVDGDSESSTVEWFNGSTSLGTSTTLSGLFSKGDTLVCTVTPNDGTEDGTPDSGSITISNAVPVVSNVVISPDPANTFEDLTVSYDFADDDGDGDLSTLVWEVDSVVVSGATGTLLDWVHTSPGSVVTVTITPDDGDDTGTPVSDTLTIDDYIDCGGGILGLPIGTCDELEDMSLDLSETYCLVQDVDCSSIADFSSVGTSGYFVGSFYGGGFEIIDLTTSGPGLFGDVLGLLDSVKLTNIIVAHTTSSSPVGAVAGW